jgi:hypothetical protein
MENSEEMLHVIVRLLKVFYLMKGFNVKSGTQQYRRAIMLQMMIFLYIKKYGLPQWEMFLENLAVYNEESGEISFSILSRCVLGDTMKFDFDHLNKMYRMMNVYLQCRDAVAEDSHGRTMRSRSHQSHEVNSVEVQTTVAHFKNVINKMRCGQFRWYVNGPKCFPTASDGDKYAEKQHVDKIYRRRFTEDVKDEINKMKEAYNPRFAQADIKSWPRSMNSSFDSDEDSPLKSDDDDDADDDELSPQVLDSDDEPLGQREPAPDPAGVLVNQRVMDSDDDGENESEEKGSGPGRIEASQHNGPGDHNHSIGVNRVDFEEEFMIDECDLGRSLGEMYEDVGDNEDDKKSDPGDASADGITDAEVNRRFPDGRKNADEIDGPSAWDGLWFPIKEIRSKTRDEDNNWVYRVRFVGQYDDMNMKAIHVNRVDDFQRKKRRKRKKGY